MISSVVGLVRSLQGQSHQEPLICCSGFGQIHIERRCSGNDKSTFEATMLPNRQALNPQHGALGAWHIFFTRVLLSDFFLGRTRHTRTLNTLSTWFPSSRKKKVHKPHRSPQQHTLIAHTCSSGVRFTVPDLGCRMV